MTQQGLADAVTALRRKRSTGRRLRLRQNSVSRICAFKRGVSPDVAEAIAHVLGNITAAALVLAKPLPAKRTRAA